MFNLGELPAEGVRQLNESVNYPLVGPKNQKGLLCKMSTVIDRKFRKKNYWNEYMFQEMRPVDDRDGFHLMFHGPFEIVSNHAVEFYSHTNETVKFEVIPEFYSYDDTFVDALLEE